MPPTPEHDPATPSRRGFIGTLLGVGVVAFGTPAGLAALAERSAGRHLGGAPGRVAHPEPRPGITGERVLASADVPERSRAAYDAARQIPQILDGLYCYCDCAERDRLRSLLSCFETRMPTSCGICRDSAELALRLHGDGRTLDEIRAAIDRRFGD